MEQEKNIKAIIGLGNPGSKFKKHRHNIGFLVVDEFARRHHADWQSKGLFDLAELQHDGKKLLLLKPQTFMNDSGKVIPWLQKKGIEPENIMVIHDELEKPFGHTSIKFGGSARGHNGLRSIIAHTGKDFYRLRFGIGRPERKEDVGDLVLSNFSEPQQELDRLIDQAVDMLED
ncbi:MAG: aminoacyl-tRNA hydrolase [Candidatus Dependentiae bacterium]